MNVAEKTSGRQGAASEVVAADINAEVAAAAAAPAPAPAPAPVPARLPARTRSFNQANGYGFIDCAEPSFDSLFGGRRDRLSHQDAGNGKRLKWRVRQKLAESKCPDVEDLSWC